MNIRPSAAIRQNYNEIADMCRKNKKERAYRCNAFFRPYAAAFSFFEEAYIPTNKYHKMFVTKWCLVLYQIQDDTVYVDYILDCRKDYSWLIR